MWGEINRMSKLKGFDGFLDHFIKDFQHYKEMYDATNPQDVELPQEMAHLNKF